MDSNFPKQVILSSFKHLSRNFDFLDSFYRYLKYLKPNTKYKITKVTNFFGPLYN